MAEALVDCVICHTPVEQILLLECNHNPCIACASTRLVQSEGTRYECSECHRTTKLEPATVQELRRVSNKATHTKSVSAFEGSIKKVRLINHATAKSTLAQIDDEAFCFECWKALSLEDMMLDAHRNHDVKMMSKSLAKLKHMLGEKEERLRREHNKITELAAFSERNKRECEEIVANKRQEVCSAFSQIIKAAEQARQDAAEAVENHFKRYLKALEMQLQEYRKKTVEADSLKEAMQDIESKIIQGHKSAFDGFSKMCSRLRHLEQHQQSALPQAPNMSLFELDVPIVERAVRFVNKLAIFPKQQLGSSFKLASSTKQLRIKTQPHEECDNSFFYRLKTKVFGSALEESASKSRYDRKTPTSDRNTHRQLSTRSDAKAKSNQPLQITKLQLKKQLAANGSVTASAKHLLQSTIRDCNKENLYRIVL